VPTGTGGVTDIAARLVGQNLTAARRQQVLVENRPGAAGTVGTEAVAKSAPECYTLLWVFPAHMVSLALYPKLPYDPIKDFAPITMLTDAAQVAMQDGAGEVKHPPQRRLAQAAEALQRRFDELFCRRRLVGASPQSGALRVKRAANGVPHQGPAVHDGGGGQARVLQQAVHPRRTASHNGYSFIF